MIDGGFCDESDCVDLFAATVLMYESFFTFHTPVIDGGFCDCVDGGFCDCVTQDSFSLTFHTPVIDGGFCDESDCVNV